MSKGAEAKPTDISNQTRVLDIATGSQAKSGQIVDKISSMAGVEIEADLTKHKVCLLYVLCVWTVCMYTNLIVTVNAKWQAKYPETYKHNEMAILQC